MNRKVILFFISSIAVVSSVSAFFVSKELYDKDPQITGEYDLWVTENTEAKAYESVSSESVNTLPSAMPVTEFTFPVTEPASETLYVTKIPETTEYLYLNLNTASTEDFMLLDGIGEVLAGNIVNYRTTAGGFRNIEEIMNVNGIGEKIFLAVREHIYVENPVYPSDPTESATEMYTETFQVLQEETEYQETFPEYIQTEPETASESPATETQPDTDVQPATIAPGQKFELNRVTRQELEMIPGMSSELAESIITLRTGIKYFSHPYELLYAEGMTEKYLAEIIDYFYVENNRN